jgi:nucleoside-diphosphate-sugar epimerase
LSDLTFYNLDQCDLQQPFRDFGKIDAIIHTATVYGRSQESINEIVQTNIVLPLRLLEAGNNFGTNTYFNTDTYFNKCSVLYRGLPNYSLSKKQFMEWGQEFTRYSNIRFVNIKLEHLFGSGDHNSKFTTYVIKKCLNNAPQIELTGGEQKRDFIYIEDAVSAYALLLKENPDQCLPYQEYELGSGQALSIREFSEMVKKLTNAQTKLNFGALPYREDEIMFSQANIEAFAKLGWQPEGNLESRLLQTIEAERKALHIT